MITVRHTKAGKLDEVVATGADIHLECMGDHDPEAGEDAEWWLRIRTPNRELDVWLGASAPIWTRIEESKEP